jgi:hypothetical protein
MKSSKRALRRHHRRRMLRRALRSEVLSWPEDEAQRTYRAVRWRDNLAKCSCYLCGNPRRKQGLIPAHELRQLAAAPEHEEDA